MYTLYLVPQRMGSVLPSSHDKKSQNTTAADQISKFTSTHSTTKEKSEALTTIITKLKCHMIITSTNNKIVHDGLYIVPKQTLKYPGDK